MWWDGSLLSRTPHPKNLIQKKYKNDDKQISKNNWFWGWERELGWHKLQEIEEFARYPCFDAISDGGLKIICALSELGQEKGKKSQGFKLLTRSKKKAELLILFAEIDFKNSWDVP